MEKCMKAKVRSEDTRTMKVQETASTLGQERHKPSDPRKSNQGAPIKRDAAFIRMIRALSNN